MDSSTVRGSVGIAPGGVKPDCGHRCAADALDAGEIAMGFDGGEAGPREQLAHARSLVVPVFDRQPTSAVQVRRRAADDAAQIGEALVAGHQRVLRFVPQLGRCGSAAAT